MKRQVSAIWLIFGLLFLALSAWHWSRTGVTTPPFEITERTYEHLGTFRVMGTGLDQPLRDFAAEFNQYVSDQDGASGTEHRIAAAGYFVAALTAFLSTYLASSRNGRNRG